MRLLSVRKMERMHVIQIGMVLANFISLTLTCVRAWMFTLWTCSCFPLRLEGTFAFYTFPTFWWGRFIMLKLKVFYLNFFWWGILTELCLFIFTRIQFLVWSSFVKDFELSISMPLSKLPISNIGWPTFVIGFSPTIKLVLKHGVNFINTKCRSFQIPISWKNFWQLKCQKGLLRISKPLL